MWAKIYRGNGMLPGKPLAEPMMTDHQWDLWHLPDYNFRDNVQAIYLLDEFLN